MNQIRNLYDFVTYCEEVNEESNEFFLIALCTAATISEEELLNDVRACLEIYYKWLKEAIDGEFYAFAHIINKAHNNEINHYSKLGKQLYKNNLITEISTIDEEFKVKYL